MVLNHKKCLIRFPSCYNEGQTYLGKVEESCTPPYGPFRIHLASIGGERKEQLYGNV